MKRPGPKKRISPRQKKQSVQNIGPAPQLVFDGELVGEPRPANQAREQRAQVPDDTSPPLPRSTATPTSHPAASREASPATFGEAEPATAAPPDPALSRSATLEALIEEERAELMQIFGVLRCLHDVLLYSDDDDGVSHADVALVCARLINECVTRLESLIKRCKSGEFHAVPASATSTNDPGGEP